MLQRNVYVKKSGFFGPRIIFPKMISGKQKATQPSITTTIADLTKCQRNASRCPRKDISPSFFLPVPNENNPIKRAKIGEKVAVKSGSSSLCLGNTHFTFTADATASCHSSSIFTQGEKKVAVKSSSSSLSLRNAHFTFYCRCYCLLPLFFYLQSSSLSLRNTHFTFTAAATASCHSFFYLHTL
jgi:hypothetical protein